MKKFTTFALLVILSTQLWGGIRLPSFFSDGMVLQREKVAPIWGWTDQNKPVSVKFAGQTLMATPDENGYWKAELKDLKASKIPATLTITDGQESKEINDVLVGEVWIASGQSNMDWSMSKTSSNAYATTVNNPLIREYKAINQSVFTAQDDIKGQWSTANPSNTPKFSAVAFHFAEDISNTLDIPVGIVELAWGGKPVEAFTSLEALQSIPEGEFPLAALARAKKNADPAKLEALNAKNKAAAEKALATWVENGRQGRKPRPFKKVGSPEKTGKFATLIYNGMIHPMIGYGIRGFIWYQGEANRSSHQHDYSEKFDAMVNDWRKSWNEDLPIYYVQLANYLLTKKNSALQESGWVIVQNEQRKSLNTLANCGMAVITDIGNPADVHPRNKKEVGHRLAQWALHYDYGFKDLNYSGPLFKSIEFKDDAALVTFDYAETLVTTDQASPQGFELAGKDGVWHPADAIIQGHIVSLRASDVAIPVKARYAWKENPTEANLTNLTGFPASCFNTEFEDE